MTAIASHANMPLWRVTGGATSMWDLDAEWATPQIVGELLRAQEDSGSYPNLMVRVGGFSARFVHLPRSLQDDVMERYRHKG